MFNKNEDDSNKQYVGLCHNAGAAFCLLPLPILQRSHGGEALEVFGEEGGIGEVEIFGDLEHGVIGMAQLHLGLGDEGTINPILSGGAAGLTYHRTKVALR